MRYFLVLIIILSINAFSNAQITYQTTYSNPAEVYRGYFGVQYLVIDAGFDNTAGASIWSVGVDTYYPISDKLGAEVMALTSLLSLSRDGFPFLFSGGVDFKIMESEKERSIPVLLSFSYEKDYINNEEIQTWSSVKLPGEVRTEIVARGGLYLRNSALEFSQRFTTYDATNLFHAGLYAGIGYNWKSYIHVQDSDGYEFAAGRFLRPYADILIIPTSIDLELDGVQTTTVEESIGWRTGIVLATKPYTPAENFDRKFGFFGNGVWRVEIGSRPIDGFYITTGVGFGLKKFK